MSDERLFRRDVTNVTGAGTNNEGAIPEATAQSTASDADIEYTLVVTDSDGERVGSTTVTDSYPLEEYGNRVLFANIGDYSSDGDNGIVDSIRYGGGEVIEDWSDRDLSDYTMTRNGGGRFELTTDPVASGPKALRSFTGARASRITSDDDLVSIEDGVEIHGEVRHETDNSSSYAMQTGFGVGVDEGGQGGIRVRLVNPGSRRTAGARIITPNDTSRIRFTPELGEFYTFEISVGVSPVQRVSAKATTLTLLPGYNEDSQDPDGDELNSSIPDLGILDGSFLADKRTSLPGSLSDALEVTREFPEYSGEEFKAYRLMNQIELSFETEDGETISDWSTAEIRINDVEDPITGGEWDPSLILVEGELEHGENNPVRGLIDHPDYDWFGGNDRMYGDGSRSPEGPLTIEANRVNYYDVEGVRASIIRGARDSFIAEIKKELLGDFWGSIDALGDVGMSLQNIFDVIGILLGPPYFYTFVDLALMADGSAYAAVWDASRYPKHYLYVDNDYRDESSFEEGHPDDGWEKNQPMNKRFRDMVLEESDNRAPFSPRREKHYEWGFDSLPAYGSHPVMTGGRDGTILTSDQLKEHGDFGSPHFPWE